MPSRIRHSNQRPTPSKRCCACVEAREAEVALLKLMVDKLKLQLLRDATARSSGAPASSFDDPQITLIEGCTTG